MKAYWSPPAQRDLLRLRQYIARDAPGSAARVVSRVRAAVVTLEQYPHRGRRGDVTGTRELVVARTPYIVVYRVLPDTEMIQILRVLHGAQEWPPR